MVRIVLPFKVLSKQDTENDSDENTYNILLVDDDSINRKIGKRILAQNGIDSVIASGGEEALLKIKESSFDLVLTDRFMPQMDGVELFTKIREEEQDRDHRIPVVMLTAESECTDMEVLLQMGFMDVISKPLTDEKLHLLLQKLATQEVTI